jgi:hypothetical protein
VLLFFACLPANGLRGSVKINFRMFFGPLLELLQLPYFRPLFKPLENSTCRLMVYLLHPSLCCSILTVIMLN